MVQNDLLQVSEVNVTYTPTLKNVERPQISSSQDAFNIFRHHWSSGLINYLEEAKMLLLNRSNRVLGLVRLSTGGKTGTIIDPKVVFSTALKGNACAIILCHNHPSGNLAPSKEDILTTRRIRDAGLLLDLVLLDHIIINEEHYYSFSEEGTL